MGTDLTPKTSTVFSTTGMKLAYKEAISKQWIGKFIENMGVLLYRANVKLASTMPFGAAPTPPVADHGGVLFVQKKATDLNPFTLDTDLDWRDRCLMGYAALQADGLSSDGWGQTFMGSAQGYPSLLFSDTRVGSQAMRPYSGAASQYGPAMSMAYTKGGGLAAVPGSLRFSCVYGAGGSQIEAWIGADAATGNLQGQITSPAAFTYCHLVAWVFYTPQTGYKTT